MSDVISCFHNKANMTLTQHKHIDLISKVYREKGDKRSLLKEMVQFSREFVYREASGIWNLERFSNELNTQDQGQIFIEDRDPGCILDAYLF